MSTTFTSGGEEYSITHLPSTSDGMKHLSVVLVHGNAGLVGKTGEEIQSFARLINSEGYNVFVPSYYKDGFLNLLDTETKESILDDALTKILTIDGVDPEWIGIVGFSLGAATAMELIAREMKSIAVFVDFYGFLPQSLTSDSRLASKFPPTRIFHNVHDRPVPVSNSRKFSEMLDGRVENKITIFDESHDKFNHAFEPGGDADKESRKETVDWLKTHLTGRTAP